MSVMNEALKKAVQEKDKQKTLSDNAPIFAEIPARLQREKPRADRTPLFILSILSLIVLLGIMGFFFGHAKISKHSSKTTATAAREARQTVSNKKSQFVIEEVLATASVPDVLKSDLSFNQIAQIALRNAKLYRGPINGTIDQDTQNAIMTFQKNNQLEVNGMVGPKTWAKLKTYLNEH